MLRDSLTSAMSTASNHFIDEIYNIVELAKLDFRRHFKRRGNGINRQTLLANDEMVVSLLSSIGNSGLVLMILRSRLSWR
jgi:hypothetical protein